MKKQALWSNIPTGIPSSLSTRIWLYYKNYSDSKSWRFGYFSTLSFILCSCTSFIQIALKLLCAFLVKWYTWQEVKPLPHWFSVVNRNGFRLHNSDNYFQRFNNPFKNHYPPTEFTKKQFLKNHIFPSNKTLLLMWWWQRISNVILEQPDKSCFVFHLRIMFQKTFWS